MNFHPIFAIKNLVNGVIDIVKNIVSFFGQALTELDSGVSKTSYSRIAGLYVIYQIVEIAKAGKDPPQGLMTVFWVLVGYQLLARVLNSLSPAALDIARSILLKVQLPKDIQPTSTTVQ